MTHSKDRSAALGAAALVFRAHGYLGTSVQQLVTATGRSRSSLYGTFGDKAGLFSATLSWYVQNQLSIDATETTSMQLRRSLDDLRSSGSDALPCLVVRSCSELADLPPEAAELLTATMERQWTAFIDSPDGAGAELRGTVSLALQYGLATLFAAGVPLEILQDAASAHRK